MAFDLCAFKVHVWNVICSHSLQSRFNCDSKAQLGSTIFYDHGDETIRAGSDVIKARDRII